MDMLFGIKRVPAKLPKGYLLGHNDDRRWPNRKRSFSTPGFRAFLLRRKYMLMVGNVCDCGWPPAELKGHKHYRAVVT